jgi:hypothetical protein
MNLLLARTTSLDQVSRAPMGSRCFLVDMRRPARS